MGNDLRDYHKPLNSQNIHCRYVTMVMENGDRGFENILFRNHLKQHVKMNKHSNYFNTFDILLWIQTCQK